MKTIKLPQMEENEIEHIIESEDVCRIAFIDDNYPYIAPFQYVYINNNLYFHLTDYGKKKRILTKNSNVCVSIEKFSKDLSEYYFISMQGKLNLVTNEQVKHKIFKKIIERGKKKFSSNFISVHGFKKQDGWDGILFENQIIYEFEQVGEYIALKYI